MVVDFFLNPLKKREILETLLDKRKCFDRENLLNLWLVVDLFLVGWLGATETVGADDRLTKRPKEQKYLTVLY